MNALRTKLPVGLCVFVLLTPATLAQDSPRPSLYVVAVGIDNYLPPSKDLQGCVNDAVNLAMRLQGQQGKLFERVETHILVDEKATRTNVLDAMNGLAEKGERGDWYALVLSGHGGPARERWVFITHENGRLSDENILELGDRLAREGKKSLIIIDACNSGQLRFAAHDLLNSYTDPEGGGIVLMVSSMASQLSAALGTYSAFAQALDQGLSGQADVSGDGLVSLNELRRYTYSRVYELRLDKRRFPGLASPAQDSAIDFSVSIAGTTPLAQATRKASEPAPPAAKPTESPDDPSTAKNLHGIWLYQSAMKDSQGKLHPWSYRLQLGASGIYSAQIKGPGSQFQLESGTFSVEPKLLTLHHRQGEDLLQLADISSDRLRFGFNGRDVGLRRDPNVAFFAGDRFGPDDPRDAVRKDSPSKAFSVKLESGQTYVINLTSQEVDPYLRIEDSNGRQLAFNDDSGTGRNARLVFRPLLTATYRLVATTYIDAAGPFSLTVERPASQPQPTAGAILLNVTETLSERDPLDRVRKKSHARTYQVQLHANTRYVIDLVGQGFDPYLRIEDSTGRQIAYNDDGGTSYNSRLEFTPVSSGTYGIIATSYSPRVGQFTLTVRQQSAGSAAAANRENK